MSSNFDFRLALLIKSWRGTNFGYIGQQRRSGRQNMQRQASSYQINRDITFHFFISRLQELLCDRLCHSHYEGTLVTWNGSSIQSRLRISRHPPLPPTIQVRNSRSL
jgi:hypothetical protein